MCHNALGQLEQLHKLKPGSIGPLDIYIDAKLRKMTLDNKVED